MIEQIKQNLSKLLLNKYIEMLHGNMVIGKGIVEERYVEIRFSYTHHLFYQTLIDDVWYENKVWDEVNELKNERYILYLCHPDIIIEKQNIEITDKLNISSKFKRTIKYFIEIPKEWEHSLFFIKKFPVVTSLQKKDNDTNIISVITTVYNNAISLEQTVQSIINQSSSQFEYLIKDAGSTDNFNDVIEKYRPFITTIISSPDKGIYYGMHEGIENSHGKYFIFLNSDDIYYTPYVIQEYLNRISENSADAYYANILKINKKRNTTIRKGSIKNIYRESSINHPTLLLNRFWYDKVNGFDLKFRYSADGDLTIRLLKSGCRFFYIDKTMVLFRIGGASTLNYELFKENMKCRYNYNKLNILGYIFIILRSIKNSFYNKIISK